MYKKRAFHLILFGVLLLVGAVLSLSAKPVNAQAAQCCISATSCQSVPSQNSCNTPANYFTEACSSKTECDYGCCCDPTIVNKNMYKMQCDALSPSAFRKLTAYDPSIIFTIDAATCNTECSQPLQTCQSQERSCGSAVTDNCLCGNKQVTAGKFCCAADNAEFSTQAACQQSPGCASGPSGTYTVAGRVTSNGLPLAGATVTINLAQQQTYTTLSLGTFAFTATAGSYLLTATKSGYNTVTRSVTVIAQDITDIEIEMISTVQDTDGDGVVDASDACPYESAIQTTSQSVYQAGAETSCADHIDNDCDGTYTGPGEPQTNKEDCADSDCAGTAGCQAPQGVCGDNTIQTPNSNGVVEQCDGIAANTCQAGCNIQTCQCNAVTGCPPGSACNSDGDCPVGNECAQCSCKPKGVCGDGQIGGKETCDIGQDQLAGTIDDIDTISKGALLNCPGICGAKNTPNQCQCLISATCGDSIVQNPPEQCDIGQDLLPGTADDVLGFCGGQGSCQPDCACGFPCTENPEAPANVTVNDTKSSTTLTVSWQHQSACALQRFHIYRCEGQNCTNFTLQGITTTQKQFDDVVLPKTPYCYEIGAYYQSGAEQKSDPACFTTKDALCAKGEFCQSNAGYACDASGKPAPIPGKDCNVLSNASMGQYTCVAQNKKVSCMYQSECDLCNGVLGMFGITGQAMWTDPDLNLPPQLTPCSQISTCFLDYTATNVDKYKQCRNVSSCYDYKSASACMYDNDTCGIGNCEWMPSTVYGEIGKGVCRPVDEAQQQCGRCNVDKGAFYEECDRDRCSLYGACYSDGKSCRKKKDITCADYGTHIDDCTGEDAIPVHVDVQWSAQDCDTNQPDCQKTAGTNAFTPSHDLLGLGKCEAYPATAGPVCIKDADNNNRFGSDCDKSKPRFAECIRDFKAPTTLIVPKTRYLDGIPLFGLHSIAEVQAADNVFSAAAGELTTSYCFSKTGDVPCYPNTTSFDGQVLTTLDPGLNGSYALRYFSEDLSGNLEEVQELPVIVDTVTPTVTISTSTVDVTDSNGNPFTNLTITLVATDNIDAQVQCYAHLEDDAGTTIQPFNNIKGDVSSTFTRTYFNLEDGMYAYNYSCSDSAGNIAAQAMTIGIEEDPSITNPLPDSTLGPLDTLDPITLSVDTAAPATCKAAQDDDGVWEDAERNSSYYETMCPDDPGCAFQPDAAKTHHTYQLHLQQAVTSPYLFNVKCRFDDDAVKGNRNDRIGFSIDLTPPAITPMYCGNDTPFLMQPYGKQIQFCLACVDDAAAVSNNSLMPDQLKIHFRNFGCGSAQYCLNTSSASCTMINLTKGKSSPITLSKSANITYSAADKGSNSQTGVLVFDVDTTAPVLNASLSTTPDGKPQTSFGYGVYFITVTANKALTGEDATFTIDGIGDIPLQQIASLSDKSTTTYAFTIEHEQQFRDKNNIHASLNLSAADVYGHTATDIFTFFLNTMPPPAPTLEPLFDGKVSQNGADFDSYPLTYSAQNDKYYTNQQHLFVTGKTLKGGVVQFYINDRAVPQQSYDQIANNPSPTPADTSTLGTDAKTNATTILIADDFGSRIGTTFLPGRYIHFLSHERESYGNYHLFYRISSARQMGPFFSELTLDKPLERDAGIGQTVQVYEKEAPAGWFGSNITLALQDNLFYILFMDRNNNVARPQSEFTVMYDPFPPVVEGTTPVQGSTSDDQTNITVVVREPLPGSLLDLSTVRMSINNVAIQAITVTNETAPDYVRYYVTYNPPGTLNGSFNVSFKGKDFATNLVGKNWSFVVDRNVPPRPNITFINATYADGLWYAASTPQFEIQFPGTDEVHLEHVTIGNASNFDMAFCAINGFNGFLCTFNNPLQPEIVDGNVVNDQFEVIVSATKTLADNTISPMGTYGGYLLVIDTVAPVINGLVDFDDYIADMANTTIMIDVSDEFHGLQGTIHYNNADYQLHTVAEPSGTAPYYTFRWEVPGFTAGDNVEQYKPFTITLSDYTGHSATVDGQVYIDRTPPDVSSFTYDILEAPVKNPAQGYFATRFTLISIVGTFKDSDIASVYLAPGNYNPQTAEYDPSAAAAYDLTATPPTFSLKLLIDGPVNYETLNQFTLNLKDKADHDVQRSMAVLADLKPPQARTVTIT